MRKQFIIKRATAFLFFSMLCLISFAQSITGTIKDNTGEAIIGANVMVKGTTNGTVTDLDGNFSINGVKASDILSISYIGYLPQSIKVGNQKNFQILLAADTKTLEEVVVIGYGTVKKSDLTSSISTVKSKQITEVTTGNAMDALQGKVNGVQVMSGGGPGSAPKVLIRGVTTVNGSDPLYVVDGMPVGTNINFLNSNDIESMEVLKDASAAAIYGTRGSNGVILITTKKGSAGTTRFTFSANAGFQTIIQIWLMQPNMRRCSKHVIQMMDVLLHGMVLVRLLTLMVQIGGMRL